MEEGLLYLESFWPLLLHQGEAKGESLTETAGCVCLLKVADTVARMVSHMYTV